MLSAWRKFGDADGASRYAATARKLVELVERNGYALNPAAKEVRRWIEMEWKSEARDTVRK